MWQEVKTMAPLGLKYERGKEREEEEKRQAFGSCSFGYHLRASPNSAGKAIFVQMWSSAGKTDSCSNINQNVGSLGRSRQ